MTGRRSNFQGILLFAFPLCLVMFGLPPSARADSPPTMRAARLTYVQGAVTINQSNNTAGVPGQLNLPLLAGVQVVTGDDGQAEIEFEDGSVVRLTPNSALSLDVLTVDPGGIFTTNLSLQRGLVYLELRATPEYRYMLDAGGDIMSPVENATVRVNFDEPPADFAVLDGTAQVERQSGLMGDAPNSGYQTQVRAGESLRGDPADPGRYFLSQQIAGDSWDQWNEDMDQAAAAQAADSTAVRNEYAGAQGYGWSDLDANGTWYDVPGQGPVWQPQIATDDSGFDPYGDGEWVAYGGTGYLWASAYPWGWTPYRCGNWSYFGGFGWGWAPGASCGGRGWGFAGGGRQVNIGLIPTGYKPVHVPVSHPGGGGGMRPIMPVHGPVGGQHSPGSIPPRSGLRTIAGVTVAPIKPVASSTISSERGVGSALRRDFPVDSQTRTPVLGLASTRPAVVYTTPGARQQGQRPVNAAVPAGQPPASYPVYSAPASTANGTSRQGGPGNRGQANQGQRPGSQNAAAPRGSSEPPLAPTIYPTYTPPAVAPTHPVYSPPATQSEHRGYTPTPASAPAPPAAQPEHRSYSPPPASAPAPSHPAASPPPPPPPAPAPAPSHPSNAPSPSAPSPGFGGRTPR